MSLSANVSSSAANGIEASSNADWSQDLDDILSSISPQKSTLESKSNEASKNSRFRVKWHTDVIVDNQNIHHGIIKDISTLGASVYLNCSLFPEKPTLHIYVPPLSSTCRPHIIEVSGRTVYVVYDGEMQLFRVAVNFLRFNLESDRTFLEERLTKHQLKIPQLALMG